MGNCSFKLPKENEYTTQTKPLIHTNTPTKQPHLSQESQSHLTTTPAHKRETTQPTTTCTQTYTTTDVAQAAPHIYKHQPVEKAHQAGESSYYCDISDDADIDDDSNDNIASSQSHTHAIVIDNGSGEIKAGFAGQSMPQLTLPCIVGTPRHSASISNLLQHSNSRSQLHIGHDANRKRGILRLSHPIQRGVVRNWPHMQHIWQHILSQLHRKQEPASILMTEPCLNPKDNRQHMTQIAFEQFECPSMYVANQAILALYASARTTGIALDSGHGITNIVPVYEGYALSHAVARMEVAGCDVDEYLLRLCAQNGYQFSCSGEKQIAASVKESLAFVANQGVLEAVSVSEDLEREYELPDGQILQLGRERFECAEIMFQPSLIGKETKGIDELLYDAIQACDIDLRRGFYENVVLAGGNTLFDGLSERLKLEVKKKAPPSVRVAVVAPQDRQYSVWIGGSVLAALPSFDEFWITNEEYQECGSSIVHRKCF